jgi:aspartate aminotransferase-like enzyme
MANEKYPYRLLTPGPVPLPVEVLVALAQPVRHHRTPEFTALIERVIKGLKWFFATKQPVLVLASTGSGAMEAAIVNTLSPGDEILSIITGKFGERWAEIATRYGITVHRLDVPWGERLPLEEVSAMLKAHSKAKAVLVQAVETSTATMSPIRDLAHLVKKHSAALLMVDAITGLGAMELPMDEWGLDVVIGGSQKALMLPTGLSFIALSEQAWKANATAKLPRYYFDLAQERKAQSKGQTFFSSANSHLVALDVVLNTFNERGLVWLRKRCEILSEATREGAKALGLKIYSQAPSPSVTAIEVPSQVDGVALRNHLESTYNVTVMGGQDQLQGKILRIGHLGHITDVDAICGMELLGQSLIDLRDQEVTSFRIKDCRKAMEQVLSRGPRVD